MLPDLCPSCHQIVDKLLVSKTLTLNCVVDGENHQTQEEILSSPIKFSKLDNTRKCKACDEVFATNCVQQNQRKDSGCELIDIFERDPSSSNDCSEQDYVFGATCNRLTVASNQQEHDDSINIDSDIESVCSVILVDEIINRKRQIADKDNYGKDCKKLRLAYFPDSLNNRDPLLKFNPKVHIMKLPDFMIDCGQPASELDQIYASFTKSLLKAEKLGFIHRLGAEPQSDETLLATLQASSDLDPTDNIEQIILEDAIIEEERDLITIRKEELELTEEDGASPPLQTNDKIIDEKIPNCFLTLTSNGDTDTSDSKEAEENNPMLPQHSDKKTEILKILKENELDQATRQAMAKEIKRMARIDEQGKFYQQVLPQIVENRKKSYLILDIDRKSEAVQVEVNSLLVEELKPHQREGIKFMYNSIIENVEEIKDSGSGCILAHDMGSGKSLQVISLIHTLLTNQSTKDFIRNIMITTPVNVLQSWYDEFDKWIFQKGLKEFPVYIISSAYEITGRLDLIDDWSKKGGVLIIGHNIFTKNALNSDKTSSASIKMLDKLFAFPGPDMVIIDEAHLLKCPKSKLYQAVARIRTKRKILVTGTHLQNKLIEYYSMIQIIKPRLLGSRREFVNRFCDPIENRKVDLDDDDIQLMIQQANELNSLVSGTIQRFNQIELYLKPKYEFVISIRPSELISTMYNFYLDFVSREHLLYDYMNLRFCVNHPFLLQSRQEGQTAKKEKTAPVLPMDHGWYKPFLGPDDWIDNELSGKFIILFKILKSCVAAGEKLVVVSQSKETLDLMGRCLEYKLRWNINQDYFRIDGENNKKKTVGQEFSDSKSSKLLLLSNRSAGIDLTAASRIIIFDVSWNPIDDNQAISRIYRFGQTKPVFVYRFVTSDTMEEVVFKKQTEKLGMVSLVVNSQHQADSLSTCGLSEYYKVRPKGEYDFWSFDIKNDRLLANSLDHDDDFVLDCVEVNSFLKPNFEKDAAEYEDRSFSTKKLKVSSNEKPKVTKNVRFQNKSENKMPNPFYKAKKALSSKIFEPEIDTESRQSKQNIDNEQSNRFVTRKRHNVLSHSSIDSQISDTENDIQMGIVHVETQVNLGYYKNRNIPRNWLNVSNVTYKSLLIVSAIGMDGKVQNSTRTRSIFESLQNKLTKFKIFSIHEGVNCIKLLTVNHQTRLKIKRTLEYLSRSNNQLDFKLSAKVPEFNNPKIKIEFDQRISPENHFDWIANIKKINHWPEKSTVIWKSTIQKGDKYKVLLEVGSNIRTIIEKNHGKIFLGYKSVPVIDEIGIVFCYFCLNYNTCKCSKSSSSQLWRCCYCASYHVNECSIKNRPDQWFCFLCKVRGHSTISKDCPVLITNLRPKLSKINHKYNYIFLDEYDHLGGNALNAMGRLF